MVRAPPAEGEIRVDIQALRGLAILLVLVHHTELWPALHSGFLGVDIFFVVSGYLITGIVRGQIEAGTFSFGEFYFRRAKRLLPAAYLVFLACSLAAPWFLARQELLDFFKQLLGAVTFTGNIALWMQSGYFETAAALKPLLHVWSLAIEEQYYLLLPAALVLTPSRWWLRIAATMTLLSLTLCLLWGPSMPGAAFYLLPTRAWELGIGSLGALLLHSPRLVVIWRATFWPALATLLFLPFFPVGGAHPGVDALLVCVATLMVIMRQHPASSWGLPAKVLSWFGDISYSLYLVHWPLLAFAASTWVAPVPASIRACVGIAAVVLAWMLYRFVEDPIRRMPLRQSRRAVAAMVALTVALPTGSWVLLQWDQERNSTDFEHLRRANRGFDAACESKESYEDLAQCRSSDTPGVFLWGDSYAMHLLGAIEEGSTRGTAQATKSSCGPLLHLSAYREGGPYNRNWGLGCLAFNRSVLQHLASAETVEVVVLSSFNGQYLEGTQVLVERPLNAVDSPLEAPRGQTGSMDLAVAAYIHTINAVRALGKRVVIVSPPPASGFDIGRCLELRASGRWFFGADHPDCSLGVDSVHNHLARSLELLDRVSRAGDVEVIDLQESLCGPEVCVVEADGTALYRDGGHLSHAGSRELGRRLRLAELIDAKAR